MSADKRVAEKLDNLIYDLERLDIWLDNPASGMTLGEYEDKRKEIIESCAKSIEEVLGAGTCHIEVKDNMAETEGMGDTWLECDKCHWQMRLEPTTPRFSYCPNCRRKVVERMKVKNNPSACVDQRERGTRTCKECYFSHVNDRNQWTGTQKCFDAGCIAMRELGVEVDG